MARSVYRDDDFEPSDAAGVLLAGAGELGQEAKEREEEAIEGWTSPHVTRSSA